MKLHEVLEELNGNTELWFRPVSWKGWETAFVIQDGWTLVVPTSHGGHQLMTSNVGCLVEDWEIVTPDQVLNGE